MDNIWIEINQEVEDKNISYSAGAIPPFETFTSKPKDLFHSLQREYGPCVSSVYQGENTRIGWVFRKRCKYTDCDDTYTLYTWVVIVTPELHPVQVTIKKHVPVTLD